MNYTRWILKSLSSAEFLIAGWVVNFIEDHSFTLFFFLSFIQTSCLRVPAGFILSGTYPCMYVEQWILLKSKLAHDTINRERFRTGKKKWSTRTNKEKHEIKLKWLKMYQKTINRANAHSYCIIIYNSKAINQIKGSYVKSSGYIKYKIIVWLFRCFLQMLLNFRVHLCADNIWVT